MYGKKNVLCYNSSKMVTNNVTLTWVYQKYNVRYKQKYENHTFVLSVWSTVCVLKRLCGLQLSISW